ncbi:MAG: DUF5683 domain-containing protein [Candidatus Glassbacteria bacterium]
MGRLIPITIALISVTAAQADSLRAIEKEGLSRLSPAYFDKVKRGIIIKPAFNAGSYLTMSPLAESSASSESSEEDSLKVIDREAGKEDSSETGVKPPEDEPQAKEKSPPGAAIRSLLVPGWGQFYTENWLKGTLLASAQVSLFILWRFEERAADRDFDRFETTQDSTSLTSSLGHQDRADSFLSFTILTTLVSVLDAYIDAHLYRFEEKVRMDDEIEVEVSVRLY